MRRLILLLLLLSCSRTREFIGSVPVADWNCGARCFRDDNVPLPMEPLFAGAPEASNAPELRYPLPGSVHPLNLGRITFQWRSDRGVQKYYRIRVAAVADPGRRYEFYVPCRPPPGLPVPQDECTYPMPERAWDRVARENRDAEVSVTIEAGNQLTQWKSEPVRLAFSPDPIDAGIYYFSSEHKGILRALFGSDARQELILPDKPTNRFSCGGCHAVSRDGRTLAFTAATAETKSGFFSTARADAPVPLLVTPPEPPQVDSATLSLNADGSLALVSHGGARGNGQLSVRNTATGALVVTLDPALVGGRKVFFPEWSPDGRDIVVTLATGQDDPWTVSDGAIAVIPYDNGQFGGPRIVVPEDGALFNFYPSWSPDGRWIAFASAPVGGKSYHNPQARLRLVSVDGGRPLELARATQLLGKASTWPRFAPVTHANGNVLYLTFDSNIDYGYLLKNDAHPTGGWPQLWLAVIDLRTLSASNNDPSGAPVWLPFQRSLSANVLGAWTERLVCGPQSPCPTSALCEAGRCVSSTSRR